MIILPDDANIIKYKKTGRFEYKPVYKSNKYQFLGTEKEFLSKGYAYLSLDPILPSRLCQGAN